MSRYVHRLLFVLALLCWCVSCGGSQPPDSETKPAASSDPAAQAEGRDQDTDEDGLTDEMEASLGTSPLLADTDGDGFSDYQEAVEYGFDPANDPYKFNPRIADVPQLDIQISKAPQVHFVYETSEGQQKSIEIGTTTDDSSSRQWSSTHGGRFSLNMGYQAGLIRGGVSTNVTTEYSFNISRTNSKEHRDSLSNVESSSSSTEKSTRGGEILVGVRLKNRGNVQLDVKAIRLVALKVPVDAPDQPIPIGGQLELDTTRTFDLIAQINPHASTPDELIFKTSLNLAQMEKLLKDGSLVIRVADVALSGAEAFTDIGAKTATVVIDPGPGEDRSGNTAETYLVAVRSTDGARGVGAGEVLRDVLHLEYETGTTPWKYRDRGTPTTLREGESRNGLRSLMGRVNDFESNGYWVATHTTRVGSRTDAVTYSPLAADYSLDDIRLHSGHILELTYMQDSDRDGLEHRAELMLGTDPRERDTDGDGLTDGEEVAGWTLAGRGSATPRTVRSDPLQRDSDGDGYPDAFEKKERADPLRRSVMLASVIGMTKEEGRALLERAGLRHAVTSRRREAGPLGVIIEQSPNGGALVEEDAEITLVVSSPPLPTPQTLQMR